MPKLNYNVDLEPENSSAGDENLSALGFHEEGGDTDENGDAAAGGAGEDLLDDEENDLEPILSDAAEAKEEAEEEESEYEEENTEEDRVAISKTKIALAIKLIENIRENSDRLSVLFGGLLDNGDEERIAISEINDGIIEAVEKNGKIIEGIFNGENMIGPDGKEYSVPANYASKSKLVEGDILKLTITDKGTFIYKQTKLIERRRIIGKLGKDSNGNYFVAAERKKFRVITASITYYKGVPGDKVVILVPVAGDSLWAAVENVIKSK